MADEKTDNPSGGEKLAYFVSPLAPGERLYFKTYDLGPLFDVDILPAHHHYGLGGVCLACEKLHEVELNLAEHGFHGEISHRFDPLEHARRAARHLIDEEYERGALSKLSARTLVSQRLASLADADMPAEDGSRDEPAKDDERLAEIRAALKKSRELGERAQSGIDALVGRSH